MPEDNASMPSSPTISPPRSDPDTAVALLATYDDVLQGADKLAATLTGCTKKLHPTDYFEIQWSAGDVAVASWTCELVTAGGRRVALTIGVDAPEDVIAAAGTLDAAVSVLTPVLCLPQPAKPLWVAHVMVEGGVQYGWRNQEFAVVLQRVADGLLRILGTH